jgi:hypothetical protein
MTDFRSFAFVRACLRASVRGPVRLRFHSAMAGAARWRGCRAAFFSALICGLWLAATGTADAQTARSQTFDLRAGWNAIYLEIDPQETDPTALFVDHPVDMVATHAAPRRGAQFARNPAADLRKAYGWAVWYSPVRPDAFLTTLYSIQGGRAYLVHAVTNATMTLSGTTAPESVTWTPDAYNLVGFAVQDPGGPTFAQFFQGSPAHRDSKIYRMTDGVWRLIVDPGATAMRRGEAFWIYCRGRSDYPGPLQVQAPTHDGLVLSPDRGGAIVFRNRTTHPVTFHVQCRVNAQQPIALSTPILAMNEEGGGLQTLHRHFEAENWRQDFPPLEAGRAFSFPLRLREMEPGTRTALIEVVSDLGTIHYVPVIARRAEQP